MSHRQTVKKFVSSRWSDEKVAQVLAFNEDRKMAYSDSCSCIVAVHSSVVLHSSYDNVLHGWWIFSWSGRCTSCHYQRAKQADPSMALVEGAYRWMANGDEHRAVVLDGILREVIAERELAARVVDSHVLVEA